jgi:hypothetical protein
MPNQTWQSDFTHYRLTRPDGTSPTGPLRRRVQPAPAAPLALPHRATPAALYDTMPKALPGPSRDADTHDRIRHDVVNKSGTVTLRVAGQLRHIGIGRTHSRTHVILLIHDLDVRIVHASTGELLHELTIDTTRDYQPRNPPMTNTRTCTSQVRVSGMS